MSRSGRPAVLTRKLVVSPELSDKFLVPAYQRGYRWGEDEVHRLLDDIYASAGPTPASYYLQPIVVIRREEQNSWELIDGQQRLTTLYLIAKYMSESNWLPRAKVNYSLLYETRENSGEYLESLDPALRHSNIDFHYIYSAYEAIGEWFDQQKAPDLAAINTWKALSERVYLIWYEAPEGTDGSELFQRLNVGRIALTDAELIKALLLSKIGVSGRTERQEQVAVQWDSYERELRDPDLWAFITGSNAEWSTHIDLIFRAMAGRGDGKEQVRYWVFERLRQRIDESAEDFWRDVVRMHGLITGWYHDRELYHLIGYLIATGGTYEFEDIVDLAKGRTKQSFKSSLIDRIRQRIGRTRTDLDDLNYQSHRGECSRILLLMNVVTVLGREDAGDRFPFRAQAGGDWSLEHIHAQDAAPLTRAEQWKTWLELHRSAIAALPGRQKDQDRSLLDRIDQTISSIEAREFGIEAKFRAMEGEVLAAVATSGDARLGEDVHTLQNLALLQRGPNSALGNSVFEVKRREILDLDRAGAYIPPCTRNVFLKYYSDDADQQLHVWGPQDRAAYYEELQRSVAPYLLVEKSDDLLQENLEATQ